ncbi:MAG: glycosyl transferase group 1 [Actinomycetia bacterium]|nr:glycosyl transferase group 1 [Actinomycetes bacterium]
MTIRLTLLVDSPGKLAHGNAASRLALGLAQTGKVEPTLLCYSADPAPSWLPPEVNIERLGTGRVSRSIPSIVHYLRERQPDVLITRQMHANFFGLAASMLAKTRSDWAGKLILVQDHPVRLSHASNWRDNKWIAKASYRYADGIISPSPAVQEDTIRWCGLDPGSVALVPNPIQPFTGPVEPPPHLWLTEGQPPVFVHTSNMTPWKRLDLLIDAFADLRRRHDARLIIVGEGGGKQAAVEQIRRLGLESSVQAVGWVEDPRQYAARACAFVLPSDEEGFAQVLTEAMSTGCPVITADAQGGGPRFVTQDGCYGVILPRGDRAKLTEAMETMLSPEVRAKYAKLGRQRAEELSPVASAHALIEFLATRLSIKV